MHAAQFLPICIMGQVKKLDWTATKIGPSPDSNDLPNSNCLKLSSYVLVQDQFCDLIQCLYMPIHNIVITLHAVH